MKARHDEDLQCDAEGQDDRGTEDQGRLPGDRGRFRQREPGEHGRRAYQSTGGQAAAWWEPRPMLRHRGGDRYMLSARCTIERVALAHDESWPKGADRSASTSSPTSASSA
jgi:hypothetical protein